MSLVVAAVIGWAAGVVVQVVEAFVLFMMGPFSPSSLKQMDATFMALLAIVPGLVAGFYSAKLPRERAKILPARAASAGLLVGIAEPLLINFGFAGVLWLVFAEPSHANSAHWSSTPSLADQFIGRLVISMIGNGLAACAAAALTARRLRAQALRQPRTLTP